MSIIIWSGLLPSQLPDTADIIRGETGAQTLLGYVVDIREGIARCHLELESKHGNRHGGLHGGIIACLLDNAMGYAAALELDPTGAAKVLTVAMNTQFLAPAQTGQVTAEGNVTGGGKNLLFVEGTLVDGDNRLLATATGVFTRVRT